VLALSVSLHPAAARPMAAQAKIAITVLLLINSPLDPFAFELQSTHTRGTETAQARTATHLKNRLDCVWTGNGAILTPEARRGQGKKQKLEARGQRSEVRD
jgi:hypothetical protein